MSTRVELEVVPAWWALPRGPKYAGLFRAIHFGSHPSVGRENGLPSPTRLQTRDKRNCTSLGHKNPAVMVSAPSEVRMDQSRLAGWQI